MRLGHRILGVIATCAACVAPIGFGTAQAATVIAGASATVIGAIAPEPVIVLSTISSPSTPTSVTLSATNVAARAEGASLSGAVSMGDSAPVVAMQASDGRSSNAGAGRAADAPQAGMLGASHKLAVELSKAELAALGAVSVTLNYN